MSLLIVLLPEQARLSALSSDPVAAPTPELDYVFSADGRHVSSQGRGAPSSWPAAQSVVAVVAPADVAWHRLTAPKAPAARLRAALAGLLEDELLDDESLLHLAVSPGSKAGEPIWVAVIGRAALAAQIEALEAAGLNVDRVVPAWGPGNEPSGHVYRPPTDATLPDPGPWLAWRDADGPVCLPAQGEAARLLMARLPADARVRWSAEPDCASVAAHLAGETVAAVSRADFVLDATRSDWNLRQFDLVPRHRGSRAATEAWRHFIHDSQWRPVRLGLLLLLAVQLAGANLWAWQQRKALTQQKQASVQLLQTTFPNVRAVRDAPVQMQKELDLLRAAAGRPGEADLEPLLQAADAAWPPSRAPADSLKYEPGRLIIGSPGWSPPEVEGFQARLRPLGYDVEAVPGRLTLTPYQPKPGDGAAPMTATPTPPKGPAPLSPVVRAPLGAPMPRPAPTQAQQLPVEAGDEAPAPPGPLQTLPTSGGPQQGVAQ